MLKVGAIKVLISECTTGVYLRWWFNGWHYFNFTNGYEIKMKTESMGTQTTRFFSVISKVERPTKLKAEYSYTISIEGITPRNIGGFTGLLMAEKVEQLEGGIWREVDISRGNHLIREAGSPAYSLTFEVTRKELPNSSSVFQKSLKLYIEDTLCDLDEDEVIPINKQTNNIAELQDRQADYTAQFKIRKTREMRALFELSGDTGVNTDFPFRDKSCKLISDNIEIITDGQLMLDRVDEQYYYVAILSGNKSFFKTIDKLKLPDLSLPSTNHTWEPVTMRLSHASDLDYVYPLCEPSDDGGIAPMHDDGDHVEMYGGWIWPFIKVKAIWDEIFSNAGYFYEGNIFNDNEIWTKLFMPIVNLKTGYEHVLQYHYSLQYNGRFDQTLARARLSADHGVTYPAGKNDALWVIHYYYCRFEGTIKFKVIVGVAFDDGQPNQAWVYKNGIEDHELTNDIWAKYGASVWIDEISVVVGDQLSWYIGKFNAVTDYSITITDIVITKIGFNLAITPHINLPELGQGEFIKMICNMFGLVPDMNSRDHRVKFWNFNELYDNIPIARDWSKYLSERDDEMEFKFGEYAQRNYFRYKDSEDVIKDNGMGIMEIDDETLPEEKDVIELPVSTCDEVTILNNIFSVNVSRINFNVYEADSDSYKQQESIDPRIVYVTETLEVASPPYHKHFDIRYVVPDLIPHPVERISSPKKASSLEVSFSYLITNYGALSRMLTKTNLRRAKFNLPVYEVAGLKHYIPIYLSQYKAYFYVNKINNYVPGKLTTVELIKL